MVVLLINIREWYRHMSGKELFKDELWAETGSYEEALPYMDNRFYIVLPTFKYNGEQEGYYIHVR